MHTMLPLRVGRLSTAAPTVVCTLIPIWKVTFDTVTVAFPEAETPGPVQVTE